LNVSTLILNNIQQPGWAKSYANIRNGPVIWALFLRNRAGQENEGRGVHAYMQFSDSVHQSCNKSCKRRLS